MATLSGENLLDASSNRLLDSSSNVITQDGIQVVMIDGGILASAVVAGGGNVWQFLIEAIISGVVEAILGSGEQDNTDLREQIDLVRYDLENASGILVPFRNQVYSEHDTLNGEHAQILAAIDEIGTPSWPPDPPGWYTSPPSEGDISSEVWGYVLPVDDLNQSLGGLSAGQVVENLWYAALLSMGWIGVPLQDNPHWAFIGRSPSDLAGWYGDYTSASSYPGVPQLDLSTVQDGDTAWSWVNREYPGYEYHTNLPNNTTGATGVYIYTAGPSVTYGYRLRLTDAHVAAAWPVVVPEPDPVEVDIDVAPVWPGSANVTLGTPQAITGQLHITGAMDGVLVNVTTPPTKTGLRQIGGAMYDYSVGEIAFETDDGDIEPWQYLGFRTAIFTPKTMKQAAGVRLRILAGAEGTVTPWTKS